MSESAGLGAFVQGYDLAGRRTSLTWPDGFGVVYGRLVTGEIASVGEAGTTAVPLLMGYDDLGRRTSLSRGSGHGQSYAYDAADRLTAWSLAGLAGGTTTAWLSYNPASQVKLRQTSDEQLSANVAYNVDRAYAANGLNQYTKAGTPGLDYDARGNLTRLASNTYAYDGDDLLTGGNAGAGLAYDALGRLSQLPDEGGTRLAYAGGMLAAEYDMSGTLRRRYLPGDGADEPLIWYEGAGLDRRYLAADERGSVVEVSDNAGATRAIDTYDDWGMPAQGNAGRFGYTGQTWLPSVQAWYYKARLYNPVLGRFHQTDPMASDSNLYRYVGNDPVNATDPSGMVVCTGSRIDTSSCFGIPELSCFGDCRAFNPPGDSYDQINGGINRPTGAIRNGLTGGQLVPSIYPTTSVGDVTTVNGAHWAPFGNNLLDDILVNISVTSGYSEPYDQLQGLKQPAKPAYCSSTLYKIGSGISSLGNGIGYVGGAFDVAAAGSFVGSGGVATPGSAALGGVGVSTGILGSAVGIVGNGVKFLAGDQSGGISSVINGLAAGLPLGSSSAKEAFLESVAGFLSDRANDALSKSPCD